MNQNRLLEEIENLRRRTAELEDIQARLTSTEQALCDSEERFRALSEHTFEAILLTEDGVCTGQNLAAETMFGYTSEEALGRHGTDWIASEYREFVKKNMRLDYAPPYEVLALRKDGTTFPCEIRQKMVRLQGRLIRVTALRDVTEGKNAEKALRESEDRYRDLVENIQDLICTHDLHGNLLFVNQAPAKFLGYAPTDMVGTNLRSYLAPEVRDQFDTYLTAIRRDGQASGLMLVHTKSGEKRIWEYHNTLRTEGVADPTVRGIARDITDQRRAEAMLKASEQRLALAMAGANLGTWEWDLTTGKGLWDERTRLVLGYESNEFEPNLKNWKKLVHPEDWPRVSENLNLHIEGKLPMFEAEYRILNKSGDWQWVQGRGKAIGFDADGKPIRMAGVVADISDRKKSEEVLRKINDELQAVIHASPVSIVAFDRDSIVKLWNPASEEIFGWSATEATGNFLPFIPEDKLEEHIGIRERTLQGERFTGIEARRKRKDGSSIDVRGSTAPLHDSEGRIAGVMAVFMDITDYKRAEEALSASEERYRALFHNAPVGIFQTDSQGRARFVNPHMAKLVAAESPEAAVAHFAQISQQLYADPQRRDDFIRILREEGEVTDFEYEAVRIDGCHRWFSMNARVSEHCGDGSLLIEGFTSDITERKQTAESLHESVELMQYIVRNDPNAIAVYDRDLHYLAVSNRYLLDYNVKEEDIIGKHHYEVFPEMPQRWKDVHQRCLLGAVESEDDDYFERPDGSVTYNRWECRPWYRSSGEIGGIITYTEVTTERKMAEKALKESEARYRHLFNNSPVGIISVDTEGRILEVNQPLLDILGSLSPEATKGINIFEQSQLVESGVSDAFRFCTTTGERALKEFPYVSKWGKQSQLRIVLTPVKDREGMIRGCQATVEDITQQRALEEQLRQAQKMEAVGTLAGGIAHDFNNLLHIIAGHAELLEMELAEKHMRFGEMDAIRQAANRGANLVKQILTFSRRVDTNFESINLNEDVQDTERLLYRTIPKMIEIDLRLEEGLRPVRADSTQIEQMLINLAVNAKDAMSEGGKLLIETKNVHLDEQYCRSHAEIVPGHYVLLRVSDTGHGMEEDVLQHIFEPFFTTKGLADGTGLGLATVFGIVKMHGGHITCESEVGKGTTFAIYFPVAEAAQPDMDQKQEVSAVAGGTERILVVDDEPLIRDLAKRMLEKAGYSVITAGSGKEGIEIYAQHKSEVALVILDLIMPEMGGKQCLEELLKINPQVKALIASGFAIKGDTKSFLDSEAKGAVSKPFNMRELLRSVRHVLDGV